MILERCETNVPESWYHKDKVQVQTYLHQFNVTVYWEILAMLQYSEWVLYFYYRAG